MMNAHTGRTGVVTGRMGWREVGNIAGDEGRETSAKAL